MSAEPAVPGNDARVHLEPDGNHWRVVIAPFLDAGPARRAVEVIRSLMDHGYEQQGALAVIPPHVLAMVAEAVEHTAKEPGHWVLTGDGLPGRDGSPPRIDVELSKSRRRADPSVRPKKS